MLFKMRKEIVQGVPFWKDKSNNLYSFDTDKKNSIHIGTYNTATETYTLKENWVEIYQSKLDEYRKNLIKRDRKENKGK
jgi:hypothetical protein